MPPTKFKPAELQFLKDRLPKWEQLKHRPADERNKNKYFNEKTRFIRVTMKDFFAAFPERDPSLNDPSPSTFSEDQLAAFPERIRQWFRNNTRTPGGRVNQEKRARRSRTHARNVATQRYHQEINQIANTILAEEPGTKRLTAFNKATTQFLEKLKEEDNPAYEKLFKDAQDIRNANNIDFTELSEEVVAKLLTEFPAKLLNQLEEHARLLPVHIWCLASFAIPPSKEVATYTLLTEGISTIRQAPTHELMVDEFNKWIRENLGSSAAGQIQEAALMVYPDKRRGSRPTLPEVDTKSITTMRLRSWLRTFFNYQYFWQGGKRSVPWKAVAKDTGNRYILASCFPNQVARLIDPSDMNRPELETWYEWIIKGQTGGLTPLQTFQFAAVDTGANTPSILYPEPIVQRPQACRLTWTATEKVYALRVAKATQEATNRPNWNGLPLARATQVYMPFTLTLRNLMGNACLTDYLAAPIISLTFLMEQSGPIHTVNRTLEEAVNVYLPDHLSDLALQSFLLHEQLQPDALLEDSPQHAERSLSSFIHYTKTNARFRHVESGTWRERAAAWRSAVVAAHLAHPDDTIGHESVSLDTHGVPRGREMLRACYEELQAIDPDLTLGYDNVEFRPEEQAARRQVTWEDEEWSDRDSLSGEEIEMPDFSSDDGDSSDTTSNDSYLTGRNASPSPAVGQSVIPAVLNLPLPETLSVSVHSDLNIETSGLPGPTAPAAPQSPPWLSHAASSITITHDHAEPGDWAHGPRSSNSDDNPDESLPATVLTDVSPMKLKPGPKIFKSRPRMTLEVVIPTPAKSRTKGGHQTTGERAGIPLDISSHDDLDTPIANRRRR